jgi:hypothetical protein
MTLKNLFLLLNLLIILTSASQSLLLLNTPQFNRTFCVTHTDDLGPEIPTSPKDLFYAFEEAVPKEGCSPLFNPNAGGKVLLIHRGNCSFAEKILHAQQAGAVAVVFVSNTSSTFVIGFNNSSNETKWIKISIFMTSKMDGLDMLKFNDSGKMLFFKPSLPFMDPNMLITWFLAVGLVVFGAIWANYDCYGYRKGDGNSTEEDGETVEIDMKMVVCYIIGACTMILILYFLYKYLVYVIIVMFCLGAASGIFSVLTHVGHGLPSGKLCTVNYIGNISIKYTIYTIISLGVPIIWFIVRHEKYGWVLQDCLGIVLILTVFKTVKFPSIKISTALLTLFFIYDIFFVFITPLFTSNGESIMVKVATGGSSGDEGSGPVETIPLTFVIPRLVNPYNACGEAFSILGYGDIVLPGLLVSFCLRFDIHKESKFKTYFISSSIGYAIGLVITFIALMILRVGQPALLYLVPCTLGTVLVLSKTKNEFKELWTGFSKPKKIEGDIEDSGGEKLINQKITAKIN